MQLSTAKKPEVSATRKQLAEEFAIAARRYYEAVVLLTQYSPVDTHSRDYETLRQKVREACGDVIKRQTAFETHIEPHKCLE